MPFDFIYINIWAFLKLYILLFFLSHFRGNVDVQGHVKKCTEIFKFADSSNFSDQRYGGIRQYHVPVPHLQPEEEKLEVSSKKPVTFATNDTGRSDRTTWPYHFDDETPNFGKEPVTFATIGTGGYDRTTWPNHVHRLNPKAAAPGTGGMRPYRAPVPRVGSHK